MKINTEYIKMVNMTYSDIADMLSSKKADSMLEASHRTKKPRTVKPQEESGISNY